MVSFWCFLMNLYDLVVETLAESRLLEVFVRLRGGRGVDCRGRLVPTGDQVRPMLPRVAGGLSSLHFFGRVAVWRVELAIDIPDCHAARHSGRCCDSP